MHRDSQNCVHKNVSKIWIQKNIFTTPHLTNLTAHFKFNSKLTGSFLNHHPNRLGTPPIAQ